MAKAGSASWRDTEDGETYLYADTRKAGGAVMAFAVVVALLWLAGAGAFAWGYLGVDALSAMPPALLAGFALIAVLPAFLMLFAGAAAREGARARAESHRLAAAAEQLLNPAPSAEAAARRLGVSVRGEIAALERAIDLAMAKAKEVETIITRQAQSMDGARNAAQMGAEQVLSGMERERDALVRIAQDLNSQAAQIGDTISRHSSIIADAARQAEGELRVADDVLDARLSSFGAAAALISDRTSSLTKAAQTSADSAHRLESVLGGALDALAKATALTDAARQSAEAATFAANNTAGAVRETTLRAIDDAKRAADVIRQEAAGVEREADGALRKLREAADAARHAARGVRVAADETAAGIAHDVGAPVSRITAEPVQRRGEVEEIRPRAPERHIPDRQIEERRAVESFDAAPRITVSPPPRGAVNAEGQQWTWREVLAAIEEERPAGSRPAVASNPPRGTGAPSLSVASAAPGLPPRLPVESVIEASGLRLGEVFNLPSLDKVAQRARNGTQARRRAVREAAPDAVRRLSDYLDRDQESRSSANEFLRSEGVRIAELLGRGRASMSADATRAFLLIDAAAA
ncbi:MAG: hypothetical protein AB7M12_05875 [Hyphomonadaceae bacterium]